MKENDLRKMLKLLNFISYSSLRSLLLNKRKISFVQSLIDQLNAFAEYFYSIHRMREETAHHSCGVPSAT